MNNPATRPIAFYLLVAAVLLQALSGLAGGIGLVGDPSGANLGIPLEWLAGSPFADYWIPGIVLLVVLGIGPLLVVYALWWRPNWGWLGSLAVGVALIIWILVEIMVIGYQPQPPLQLIYGVLGILIVVLALLPQVRRYVNAAKT